MNFSLKSYTNQNLQFFLNFVFWVLIVCFDILENDVDLGVMRSGMVFTVEPVISQGSRQIVLLDDNWTAVSIDNSRSAQFEHTILISSPGNPPQILTQNYL